MLVGQDVHSQYPAPAAMPATLIHDRLLSFCSCQPGLNLHSLGCLGHGVLLQKKKKKLIHAIPTSNEKQYTYPGISAMLNSDFPP